MRIAQILIAFFVGVLLSEAWHAAVRARPGELIWEVILLPITWALGLCAIAVAYVIPTVIAKRRKHKHFEAIVVLNLGLGWTIVGWVVAIVWCLYREPDEKSTPTADKALE